MSIIVSIMVAGLGLAPCSTSTIKDQLSVGGIGQQYLAGTGGVTTSEGNRTLTLQHNNRGYFANRCVDGYANNMFTSVPLLGKEIRFQVDVSELSCGCNGAFYLVDMPGPEPGQSKDYYCDANDVNNQWCTEMDIMEANSHGFGMTAHACHTNYSSDTCDKSGCGKIQNSYYNSGYGVGGHNIDTSRPFNVSIRFITKDGVLSNISGQLSQSSMPGISLDQVCSKGEGYLKSMTESLQKGMVLVYSLWGTTMTWLDKCPPSEKCNTSGNLHVSDVWIGDF
eukprot:TRINITY_DN21096_c0_g1_i1.p1 TRINITY_DN21096_c0_g1~~TRINITY_DN21096_c0_g1_i1.p1  ORF type:complete len:280 (+),score=43.71 TRINITY_DN21096_c0_g1_i1:149-988(+)